MTSRLAVPYYIFVEAFDAVSQGFGAKAAQIKWLVVVGPITTETGSVKGLICLSFPASTLVLSIELLYAFESISFIMPQQKQLLPDQQLAQETRRRFNKPNE